MNPRKNLQKRKNRRKKNERWFNKHLVDSLWHEFSYAPIKMISLEEMKEMYPDTPLREVISNPALLAGRQCGKSLMLKSFLEGEFNETSVLNWTTVDKDLQSLDITKIPEDEIDLVRRYRD